MTFKKLFVGFNLGLLFAIAITILLPVALLGQNARLFLENNPYGIGIMVFGFIGINAYFVRNWQLFVWLEEGNWPAILGFLERKIYREKLFYKSYIQYFIEAAIQTNQLELLLQLITELKTQARQRINYIGLRFHYRIQCRRAARRLCEFALELGLPHLVEDPGYASELYFGEMREFESLHHRRYATKALWVELFYGISLLVQRKHSYACAVLEGLLQLSHRMPLISLLCIQLLEELQEEMQGLAAADSAEAVCPVQVDAQLLAVRRTEIQGQYGSAALWAAYIAREQGRNISISMIRQLVAAAYEQQLKPLHTGVLKLERHGSHPNQPDLPA